MNESLERGISCFLFSISFELCNGYLYNLILSLLRLSGNIISHHKLLRSKMRLNKIFGESAQKLRWNHYRSLARLILIWDKFLISDIKFHAIFTGVFSGVDPMTGLAVRLRIHPVTFNRQSLFSLGINICNCSCKPDDAITNFAIPIFRCPLFGLINVRHTKIWVILQIIMKHSNFTTFDGRFCVELHTFTHTFLQSRYPRLQF